MTIDQTKEPTPRKPLRLWPGVVAVVLLWLVRYGVPIVAPGALAFAVFGGLGGGLLVVLWWLFFSRAPWSERVGAILLMTGGLFATSRIVHKSISSGMMGMMLPIFAIPVLCLALVCWAVATRRLSSGPRRAWMVATILLACGVFTLLRTGGITGDANSDFHWRWTQTPEERLLAQAGKEPAAPRPTPAAGKTVADWPGFRGPERDGILRGVRIATNWSASPPVELWRRPIGPGWSSFAVHGDLLYTQEQRGEEELVACYYVASGQPVWKHSDAARFWESNAGAGPRATPTLSNGRVYTFGGTGIVNALDAADGAVVWSRNAAADTGKKVPGWGFASSPLVVDDLVIVAAAGVLVAYDLATGKPRWFGPASGWGYSSPHLVALDGVKQILLLNGAGAISVAPTNGTRLWEHAWDGDGIVQPALTADGDVLIGTGSGMGSGAGLGVRRITVAHGPAGWTTRERWTSTGLKPYFNDFVVHKGYAFGFDGSLLACIGLEDGKRKWKGGRYGHGQMVLLADQDLLLVLSEQGGLALVAAASEAFTELARFPALKGKTWNHPVLAGDALLVRNDQEMAAFRLALASLVNRKS
ncbi:MAG TPA: PQQ-binding-like beta-propeller repeat protein [Candidatus Acidoferrum sp.]|jgi:outer membrane protein assembly factor BamB|nr:PQQ-binding-like beta-propeller repeat protein [Candidatus Acidoferrum sp.]